MNQTPHQGFYAQQQTFGYNAYGGYNFNGQAQPQGQQPVYQDNYQQMPLASDQKVDYTEYDALVNYPPGTDMNALFNKIKNDFESHEWTAQFAAIDALRILNKFYPQEINGILNAFGSYIQAALSCAKPFIAKNILVFINEFLQNAKNSGLNKESVVALIPILLQKSSLNNKILQLLADKGLQFISMNCLCDEVIQAFCVNSATKNKISNKKSFYYLAASIDAIKENVSQLNSETLKIIFQCNAHALLSDCAENKTYAKQMLVYVRGLMGNDNYTGYVGQLFNNGCISMAQGEALVKAVEAKHDNRKSLADALREVKSTSASLQLTKSMSLPHM